MGVIESVRESINQIELMGDKAGVVIMNEDDVEEIFANSIYRGIDENKFQEIFGVKVLKIPNHLRDNTFLNDGQALVIGERHFKELKEAIKSGYYKN